MNDQLKEHQHKQQQPQSPEHTKDGAITQNGPGAIAQRKLQETINNSAQVQGAKHLQLKIDNSSRMTAEKEKLTQLFGKQTKSSQEGKPIQKKENTSGLPVNLKTGIENLSGMSMDDVKVNSNSSKPAELNALAYAQGNQIHLGPGQEKHLPHEAWHVVQQREGRVQPTVQMKGVAVNNDNALEKEADEMGAKALQTKTIQRKQENKSLNTPGYVQRKEAEDLGRKITCDKGKSIPLGTSLNYTLQQLGDELWSADDKLSYHWVVENDMGTQFIDKETDQKMLSCTASNPGNYNISVQVLNKGVAVPGMKYTYQQNAYMEKHNTELGGLSVGNFDFKFDGKKIEVYVKVKFEFEDTIAEASHAPFKNKFFSGVNSKWGTHGRVLQGTSDKGNVFDIPINISCYEVTDNSYHKVVDVAKDEMRPKVIDEINVYLGVSENTIAHEFGHVLGLTDEYDGGWMENIMFWHDDGSNQTDDKALMNGGTEMRDRYFMLYKAAVESTAAKGYSYKIK